MSILLGKLDSAAIIKKKKILKSLKKIYSFIPLLNHSRPAGLAPYSYSGTQATGDSVLTHAPMIDRAGEGNAENQALASKVPTEEYHESLC